jgi:hypothetical protein
MGGMFVLCYISKTMSLKCPFEAACMEKLRMTFYKTPVNQFMYNNEQRYSQ